MFFINIPLGVILVFVFVILIPKGRETADTGMPNRSLSILMFARIDLTVGTMYGYVDGFLYTLISSRPA